MGTGGLRKRRGGADRMEAPTRGPVQKQVAPHDPRMFDDMHGAPVPFDPRFDTSSGSASIANLASKAHRDGDEELVAQAREALLNRIGRHDFTAEEKVLLRVLATRRKRRLGDAMTMDTASAMRAIHGEAKRLIIDSIDSGEPITYEEALRIVEPDDVTITS